MKENLKDYVIYYTLTNALVGPQPFGLSEFE